MTCPLDCRSTCGNQFCDNPGDYNNGCPQECASTCNSGRCDYPGDYNNGCPIECTCGDGICQTGELTACPKDCFGGGQCGNGICEIYDIILGCLQDCTGGTGGIGGSTGILVGVGDAGIIVPAGTQGGAGGNGN